MEIFMILSNVATERKVFGIWGFLVTEFYRVMYH